MWDGAEMAGHISVPKRLDFYVRSAVTTLRRGQQRRDNAAVLSEYSSGWDQYKAHLQTAASLDEWMNIPGVEDKPAFYNINGALSYEVFNFGDYYRRTLLSSLRQHFPGVRSVTEFGCGIGRNLLFLKREFPELQCFGYELCEPGVEVAAAAAAKFGLDISYSQLDYLNDPSEKYVFPSTDVAFTMFSLEQLPRKNDVALKNILAHVRMGSIHIEPVPENYPWSIRGVLGRIEHRRVDYLSKFDATVRALNMPSVTVKGMTSAHNPLMYPSLYVLKNV
jgi:SAM-dependent methyltransferase